MTLRLILTRHAKSDWGDGDVPDHDRPLNARGRAAAPTIGAWLADKGHRPEAALVSTATRTQQTWAGIADTLGNAPEAERIARLYLAPPEVLLGVLRQALRPCVIMIAHNPGIAAFAQMMVRQAPDHPRWDDYPTGATAVMDFDAATWPSATPQTGRLVDFMVPRDLA